MHKNIHFYNDRKVKFTLSVNVLPMGDTKSYLTWAGINAFENSMLTMKQSARCSRIWSELRVWLAAKALNPNICGWITDVMHLSFFTVMYLYFACSADVPWPLPSVRTSEELIWKTLPTLTVERLCEARTGHWFCTTCWLAEASTISGSWQGGGTHLYRPYYSGCRTTDAFTEGKLLRVAN